jgi:CubicO group peptidase (beta-lactamase class C family)
MTKARQQLITRTSGFLALATATVAGCTRPNAGTLAPVRIAALPTLVKAMPREAGIRNRLNADLDSIMQAALASGAAPGGVIAIARYGRIVHMKGYGRLDTAQTSAPVDENSIYDMASLTKVIATTTAAMILEERGLLDLDRTVASYLPELNSPEKATITVRMIATHRGGFEAFAALYKEFKGREQYLAQINARPLQWSPGTQTVYSDWDMILMQLVIERITGRSLDELAASTIFIPLGMTSTVFTPDSARFFDRIAPTEIDSARGGLVHAHVHDENAWAMGGVAGQAGLFSSVRDVAIFCQMLLNGGQYNGVRILKPSTIARWTAPQSTGSSRALGWDTPSAESSSGSYFSARSFGHTGFTGTSIWVDPERNLFVILLTNRVNPTRDNPRIGPLRRAVADAVQEAITDAPLVNWEMSR